MKDMPRIPELLSLFVMSYVSKYTIDKSFSLLSPSLPPCRYIPVAVWGSKELLKRAKHQNQETKQHKSRLEVIPTDQALTQSFPQAERSLICQEWPHILPHNVAIIALLLPVALSPTIIPAYQYLMCTLAPGNHSNAGVRYGFWLSGPPGLWGAFYSHSALCLSLHPLQAYSCSQLHC